MFHVRGLYQIFRIGLKIFICILGGSDFCLVVEWNFLQGYNIRYQQNNLLEHDADVEAKEESVNSILLASNRGQLCISTIGNAMPFILQGLRIQKLRHGMNDFGFHTCNDK